MATSDPPQGPDLNIIRAPDLSLNVGGICIPPPPIPCLSLNSTGPRLIIKELSVKNFKSYAGVKTLGPFHKNFTTIIGPNGSGKSNVIDALLFVFGYRAQKIRSKKVSVLIHKSDDHPGIDCCSVTVHFATITDEGKTKYNILPDSEFSITRTGFLDNTSVYDICGKRVQYRDVNQTLRKYGIDLEYNRFLILQGEIELISMMKPKGQNEGDIGMIEYLEDIIGSNRYIEPIKHFNNKAEELEVLRVEKSNQLKIIEKDKQDIEKPKNEAIEYLKLENKITVIENSVLQIKLKDAFDDLKEAQNKRQEADEKGKQCLLQQEEFKLKMKSKQQENEKSIEDYEKALVVVDDLKEKFNALERQDIVCREQLKHVKEKIKKMVKNLDNEEQLLQTMKKQTPILKSEFSELQAKLADLDAKKLVEDEKMAKVMKALESENKGMREEKDKLELELIDLKSVVFKTKSERDIAESELTFYLRTEKQEKEKLNGLIKDLETTQKILNEKLAILKEAEFKVPECETKLATAKQQLEDSVNKEKLLTAELFPKRVKVEELKSSFSASCNRNAMLQAFLEEKQKGRLTGVYGRLGDLGAIDEKYDVAVSTACHDLDNIVTDTLVTAQECVEFLKANNLGYTTFIALDKMAIWEPYTKQKIKTPENVPRLFDLIRVQDPAVLPAFYYSLKNTLIAKDLEEATRIGLQGSVRYRIVTLKGELIDLSGTMSGGGGRPLKGKMGQSVASSDISPQELDVMIKEVAAIVDNVAQLRDNIMYLEQHIERTTKEISSLKHSINKAKIQYNAYKETTASLEKQVEDQKQVIIREATDKKVIKELENKIAEKEKAYLKASESASVIEVQVKRLTDKMMSTTESKFKVVQGRIDQINKDADKVRAASTKTSVSIKTLERKIGKGDAKIESLQKEIEQVKKTKEKLVEEFNSLSEKATVVMAEKEAAEKNVEVCLEKKNQISKQIKIIHDIEHQLKSDYIEHKHNLKVCDADVREKQGGIKALQAKLSKLKLHDVGEELEPLPTFTMEEISAISINSLSHEKGIIQALMDGMKPDLSAIEEYRKIEELYNSKQRDLHDTIRDRNLQKAYYEELRKFRFMEFVKGFAMIARKLKETYQMLTLGGDAELELVDSRDPFSEGITFSVRPPKKSWKAISNLSGGEKTLSSLALVFALHFYRPTPFYVMDEIDAALDFQNVAIVGCYVKEHTKNAQFIIISLRNSMFEQSDHVVGIYKTDNCTHQIVLNDFESWFIEGDNDEDEGLVGAAAALRIN